MFMVNRLSMHFIIICIVVELPQLKGVQDLQGFALVLYGNVIVDETEFRILSRDAETRHSNARTRQKKW